MEFMKPMNTGFTIYSKTGCTFCIKLKNLLKEKQIEYTEIICDEYKEPFFSFIKQSANKEYKTYPMVFYDEVFIGGYRETSTYINKLFIFEENEDF